MPSQKIEFPNKNGEMLAARFEVPSTPIQATAIFAHCFTCSKDIAAASRISRALSEAGIAVLRFDFTGLGNSDGDFANTNFSSNVQDLVSAADFLKKQNHAPSLLVGHSLGGAAVLAAANEIPELKAIATIAAPSAPDHVSHLFEKDIGLIEAEGSATVNLAGRKFQIKKQFLDDLKEQNIGENIHKMKRALLIFHSPVDELVGIEHAKKIYEKALHPKSFVSLDHADHLLSKPIDSTYVAGVLAAWASRYLELKIPEQKKAVEEGVVWVGENLSNPPFGQDITAGSHRLVADEPASIGGKNQGPTPYDYLLAGLGACTSMTIRMYANHKKIPLERVQVSLKHSKIHAKDCEDCETKVGKIDQIEKALTISGDLTEEQRQKLLEIADKCPVHRTLHSEVKVLTQLT